jgi:hypothetical protein
MASRSDKIGRSAMIRYHFLVRYNYIANLGNDIGHQLYLDELQAAPD